MITQYVMTFIGKPDHPLYPAAAYRLYAHLLERLPREGAAWLHETENRAISQFLRFDKGENRYAWTLNILSDEAAAILCPVLDELSEVAIEHQVFRISDKSIRTITAEFLLQQARHGLETRKTLSFCTTTSFKQNGRYVIFPQERLILQSLIMHWNEVFPMYMLADEDAFNAMLAGIHIVDYQLRSSRFHLKGIRIPGFVGSCVVEAKLALPLLELWNTLLLFAEYAGIGIKTGLGMGGTRLS